MFCLDPTSPEGAELVEYVKLFLDHVVPARCDDLSNDRGREELTLASLSRLGLLLVSDVESEEEAGEAAEEGVVTAAQLIRLFHYLSQHKSAREALRWLYQVAGSRDPGVAGVGWLVWGGWCGEPGVGSLVWGAWCGEPGVGCLVWGADQLFLSSDHQLWQPDCRCRDGCV